MAINDKIGLYLEIQMDKSMAFLNVVHGLKRRLKIKLAGTDKG